MSNNDRGGEITRLHVEADRDLDVLFGFGQGGGRAVSNPFSLPVRKERKRVLRDLPGRDLVSIPGRVIARGHAGKSAGPS